MKDISEYRLKKLKQCMDKLDSLIKDVAYIKAIVNLGVILLLIILGCTLTLIAKNYFFAL